jgi:flagellar biosynthesis/type III secretory pathway M-ring protein FliF/YscJ
MEDRAMNVVKRTWTQVRTRIGSMNRSRRMAIAVAGLVLMGGGIYLACSGGSPELSPVVNQTMGEAELTAWASALAMHGIDSQVRDHRLVAAPADLQRARAVLAYEGMISRDLVGAFEQVAREDDIWRTGEQNDKRWQAAKMATLSKLIGTFPPVRAATVIIEPGAERSLAGPGRGATAAVNVTLRDGRKMSRQLVEAIADLVCGSVAGLARQDVRIVDSTGRSHRAGAPSAVSAEEQLEDLRAAEAYFAQKIRLSLNYIDNVMVTANVAPGELTRCRCATVSVPRSYLLASMAGQSAAGADSRIDPQSAPQLAKIQQAAMKAIGATDSSAVTVDWYYDAPSPASPPSGGGVRQADAATLAGAALAICLVAVALNALRRRWAARRRRSLGDASAAEAQLPAAAGLAPDDENRSCTLGLLQHMNTDSLIEIVRGEHPQTIAIVLSHLGMSKAAAVLAALSPQEQVDVSRRMAALEKLDAQVVAGVERSLSARLAATPAAEREQLGGVTAVAQMLYHAGYATGQTVLHGLASREPALAESIRRRMFSLEDVAALPPGRLRAALADVDGDDLSLALCAATENVQSRILSALGGQAARRVREGMAHLGPVRISDVEAAQETILEAVRREEGLYVAEHTRKTNEATV